MSGVSPWLLALGDRSAELAPELRAYFSTIPAGKVGRGRGTFHRLGTPRRWLWPVLAVLGRAGIIFPVWEHDVPFEIENRPDAAALHATRTFHTRRGELVMRDVVRMTAVGLTDTLGTERRLRVRLDAQVIDGSLELRSRGASVRVGRLHIPLPLAPRVHLVERRDGARQRVELTMTMPLVGRVYEYSGSFDYEIVDTGETS